MVTAICLLTIPLLVRCFLDWMQRFQFWLDFVFKQPRSYTTYNIVFFLTSSYLLIISQCVTLVFGLIRASQMTEYKKTKAEIKEAISASRLNPSGGMYTSGKGYVFDAEQDDGSVHIEEEYDTNTVTSDSDGQGDFFAPPIQMYAQLTNARTINHGFQIQRVTETSDESRRNSLIGKNSTVTPAGGVHGGSVLSQNTKNTKIERNGSVDDVSHGHRSSVLNDEYTENRSQYSNF